MKRISKASQKKLVVEILSSAQITRDQAHYLIKTFIGVSLVEFSKIYGVSYHFLHDCLMARRPFALELQEKIREASFKKLNGKKVVIAFE